MVMELGSLASTRWTSTVPHPFRSAPGGGLGGTRWTSTVPHPFAPAPGAGMGIISTNTQRADIGPDQLPVVQLRVFVMAKQPVPAPMIDKAMLPAAVALGYKPGPSQLDTFPLTVSWARDPNERDMWEAKVTNAAGPFTGETVDILAGRPTPEDSRDFPTVGTMWSVNLRPNDGVFNDGKLALLLDGTRKARSQQLKPLLGMASTKQQIRIFGEDKPKPAEPPKPVPKPKPTPPKPTPKPKPAEPLMAGVGALGLFLIAYNLLSPHVGSERFVP